MRVIRPFDPWKSKLCTCPEKYSFNPYTGCAHDCTYCYATYIPNFRHLREKKDLFRNLERDLKTLPPDSLISMSNSSDPYPPVERQREITRKCLSIMREYDVRLLVVTKSDIVVRDLDILSEMRCAVSITITGLDFLEPNAPPTEKRIDALRKVKDAGLPAILRFDPVIPEINENRLDIIDRSNPDHVVTSTLKLKPDSLARVSKILPGLNERYRERVGRYYYMKREDRYRIMKRIEEFCLDIGISCAFCREGFEFRAESCDGSHLVSTAQNNTLNKLKNF
ncbi:SPL family radical SAM protein [Archaeoglobus neptunius]|uniref:SPL family radical SAM protein n=1 Tax=Archaeoglobus neptunius TaxID=2798580 RepID=UPI00192613F3|nr:radical SAM protein [Archaeoglobus neptunius]